MGWSQRQAQLQSVEEGPQEMTDDHEQDILPLVAVLSSLILYSVVYHVAW